MYYIRRYWWTPALLFGLLLCLILYSTRSLTIERGLRLDSHETPNFTYGAWSYGNWAVSEQDGVRISTYSPPYTLVLAIQPADPQVQSIELLAAFVTDKNGRRVSIHDKINSAKEDVELRSGAVVTKPYAAIRFESLLDTNDPITLEIEFRDNSSSAETVRQSLELKGFESRRRSFTFWDVMSSA